MESIKLVDGVPTRVDTRWIFWGYATPPVKAPDLFQWYFRMSEKPPAFRRLQLYSGDELLDEDFSQFADNVDKAWVNPLTGVAELTIKGGDVEIFYKIN
jgi:hypothetical protein